MVNKHLSTTIFYAYFGAGIAETIFKVLGRKTLAKTGMRGYCLAVLLLSSPGGGGGVLNKV